MRSPPRIAVWFARGWPTRIWLTVVPLLGVGLAIRACELDPASLRDGWLLGIVVGVVVLAGGLGWFVGILTGWFVLGPLYLAQACRNGGPFTEGDRVMVLCGDHSGTITSIYAQWQGDQVRVALGDAAQARFADVFSPCQLWRVNEGDRLARALALVPARPRCRNTGAPGHVISPILNLPEFGLCEA